MEKMVNVHFDNLHILPVLLPREKHITSQKLLFKEETSITIVLLFIDKLMITMY